MPTKLSGNGEKERERVIEKKRASDSVKACLMEKKIYIYIIYYISIV